MRPPLLRNSLRQSHDAGLGQTVIRLPGIPMCPARTTDINDDPFLAVLDPEIRSCLPDQAERRSVMHGQHRVPLLVRDLVDDTVPSVTRIIHDDVDLAVAELCGLLDQHREVMGVGHVAGDADCPAGRGLVNRLRDTVGLGRVDVADNYLCALVGKEAGAFGADTLTGASDLENGQGLHTV